MTITRKSDVKTQKGSESIRNFLDHHEIEYYSITTLLKKFPNGLCGQEWDVDRLSSNSTIPWSFIESHDAVEKFHKLPLTQQRFRDELVLAIEERKYRPGNQGYIETKL